MLTILSFVTAFRGDVLGSGFNGGDSEGGANPLMAPEAPVCGRIRIGAANLQGNSQGIETSSSTRREVGSTSTPWAK